MKFKRYNPSKKDISHTTDAKQIPMFFLTDVSGMGEKVHNIVESINRKRGGQTPLFVYDEPFNSKFNAFNRRKHAEAIASEIVRKLMGRPQPIMLFGFSQGGGQAVEAAHILKRMGYPTVIVWDIDKTSPKSVTEFCESDNDDYKMLLIDMVREASKDSFKGKHNPNFINLNDEFLAVCDGLDLEGRIEWLADQVRTKLQLKANDPSKEMQSFNHIIAVMKRNAANAQYEPLERTENDKIDHLFLLLTNETKRKYGTDDKGGWEAHSNSVVDLLSLNEKAAHLADAPHMELMKPENADLIADLILESQKQLKELDPIELAEQQQEAILRSLRAQLDATPKNTPEAAKLERKIRKLTAMIEAFNHDEEDSTSDEEAVYASSPAEDEKKSDVNLFGIFNKTALKKPSKSASVANNVQVTDANVQQIEITKNDFCSPTTFNP